MWRKFTALMLVAVVAGTLVALPATAQENSNRGGNRGNLAIPLSSSDARLLSATWHITQFYRQNNQIWAVGTVIASVNDGSGRKVVVLDGVRSQLTSARSVTPSSAPLASAAPTGKTALQLGPPPAGACPILDLQIAPINLNLLGLVVRTDTIALQLFAQPGQGALLGNLLCAITGLLDPGGSVQGALDQIVNLLNQILGAL